MPEPEQESSPVPLRAESTERHQVAKQWSPLIAAAFGIVGVAIGGYIQFYTARLTQREAHVAELRRDAYASYLEAQAIFQRAESLKGERKKDEPAREFAKYADAYIAASFQLAIYGPPEVIPAVLEFHRRWNPDDYKDSCGEGWQQFAAILKEMRSSVLGKDDPVEPGALYSMVFRCGTGDGNAQ